MPGSVRQWTLVALVRKTSLQFDCWKTTVGLARAGYNMTWPAWALVSHSDIVCLLIQSNCTELQLSINILIWVAWFFDHPVVWRKSYKFILKYERNFTISDIAHHLFLFLQFQMLIPKLSSRFPFVWYLCQSLLYTVTNIFSLQISCTVTTIRILRDELVVFISKLVPTNTLVLNPWNPRVFQWGDKNFEPKFLLERVSVPLSLTQ
jgi:hypothetical protein